MCVLWRKGQHDILMLCKINRGIVFQTSLTYGSDIWELKSKHFFFFLQPVEATDDAFWDQFWADTTTTVQDVFALVPAAEIRAVREESPSNLATLCYKVHTVRTVKNASASCKCAYEMRWDCRRTSLSLRVHRGIMLLWNAAGLVCLLEPSSAVCQQGAAPCSQM